VGKFSRDKGARGERELRDILNKQGYNVRRGRAYGGEPDLVGLDGIHIECKSVEKLNVRKALQQAIDDSESMKDGIPAVFWKKKHDPQELGVCEGWTVTLQLADFLEILEAWNER